MLFDRWSWTASDWDRIERVARAERSMRALLADSTPAKLGAVRFKGCRAVADGAALELRQWARLSFHIPIGIPSGQGPKPGRARGGHARAQNLSPERRSEIARKAASARWGK